MDKPTSDADAGPIAGECSTDTDCADVYTCTQDLCVANWCTNELAAGHCLINGQCQDVGDNHPTEICNLCDPTLDPTRWMPGPGCVGTLAGDGTAGFADGPTATARFSYPDGVAVDNMGRVLVTDRDNNRVRMIWNGQVTTLAGDGTAGFADGPAASARFNQLQAVTVEGTAKVYVSEYHRIRVIEAGQVTTLAGDGTAGFADGPAAIARFNVPGAIAVNGPGTLIVADTGNARVRKVAAGQVITIAGTGVKGNDNGPAASASFTHPNGVAVDGAGVIYISDGAGYRLRRLASGQVTTFAGTGAFGLVDGPAASARFDWPTGLACNPAGKVFVPDWWNHRIRVVWNGQVTTLAGSGPGYPSDGGFADGPVTSARFAHPDHAAVDGAGRVFISDPFNNRIRVIVP